MNIRKARQLLKSFADDTRLRIINLLSNQELTVSELCEILDKKQSNLSKHLAKLRLTDIAGFKRKGASTHYFLIKPKAKAHEQLIGVITDGLADLKVFKQDIEMLNTIKKNKESER